MLVDLFAGGSAFDLFVVEHDEMSTCIQETTAVVSLSRNADTNQNEINFVPPFIGYSARIDALTNKKGLTVKNNWRPSCRSLLIKAPVQYFWL